MALTHGPRAVTDGLALYLDAANPKSYPGSGTTCFDLSETKNNGTLTGGVTFSGSDFNFDGTDDFISITSISLLSAGSTISAWINILDFITGKSSTGRTFIRGASSFTSMVAFYNGGYSFETDTNSNPHEISGRTTGNVSSPFITAGSWFNFVLVFNAGNFTGYVNSVQTGSAAILNNLTFSSIGNATGFADSYPAFFKGKMSAVSVYNRALSVTEIQTNFQSLRGRFGI